MNYVDREIKQNLFSDSYNKYIINQMKKDIVERKKIEELNKKIKNIENLSNWFLYIFDKSFIFSKIYNMI